MDFNTCINRDDVDEGVVFKSYNEYKEAVADEVKKSGGLDVLTGALEERGGEVYLTFDDGPIDATEGVLNVLRETGTKATFFINAFHLFGEGDENEDNALKFLKQTVKDGHIIANHSYDHMLNNCCRGENKDECGAIVCNEIAMWNVKAYQNLEDETENFHLNTKIVHQVLKHDRNGEIPANDHMGDMAWLPYTNSWRIPGMDSDCACCTTDDVPPWDENFICSLEDPTFSATLSGIVASELYKSGLSVYGWDIEWGPEDWGAADPAASLTSAEDLAKSVMEVAEGNKCEMQAEKANIALCSVTHHQGKVVILTHDFLFEDGGRGMGATTNLPKLRKFIEIMKENGYIFKTVDQYHDDTFAADAGVGL